MLYVLCGSDASGKATQAKILAEKIGCKVLSFPAYETPTGREIKAHLNSEWQVHSSGGDVFSPKTDALVFQSLMLINRMEHYDTLALAAGSHRDHLVLDRYTTSGIVYGTVEGLDRNWLELIHRGLPKADYTVLLDLDPRIGWERRPERRDRNERDMEKLQKVRGGYLGYFAEKAKTDSRWSIVDASGTIETVAQQIAKACCLTSDSPPARAESARKRLADLEIEYAAWTAEQQKLAPNSFMAELDSWIEKLGLARHEARKADREMIAARK